MTRLAEAWRHKEYALLDRTKNHHTVNVVVLLDTAQWKLWQEKKKKKGGKACYVIPHAKLQQGLTHREAVRGAEGTETRWKAF